ncbi:glycosyltransferase family 4 protein [Pedobacter sp. Leaf250]|uniref:glycosyltransferase family 4 protein n=1 Tax=Pedobacter sp. Leaf250 TaxID=2876559 RepID=UPI001E2B4512|nr:glycosyltransferase family 4 protein [Pedobacter sp. Leaf250]
MNILLATHNFYPYYQGGTEVYVLHLAKHLLGLGHHVQIISALDEVHVQSNDMIYNDANILICQYLYEGISIYGVFTKSVQTPHIYSRNSKEYADSYVDFFKFKDYDLLHLNGFTITIGLDIIFALKTLNPNLKLITSYHTAISDPKETLTFGNTLMEKPQYTNHTADVLSYRFKLPYGVIKSFAALLPNTYLKKLPAIFNMKYLVKHSIESFEKLVDLTDEWWVYSDGIKNHLLDLGVKETIIKKERHGITPIFFQKERIHNTKKIHLFSGRPVAIKGIKTLLKAWLLLKEDNQSELWLTASPISNDKKIQELIDQTKLRNDIKWLREVNQAQLAEIYCKADFVIVPSECYEIGPLVIHEAIACGCQIIASNIGGCKELLNHYNMTEGLFIAGNSIDLSRKIIGSKKSSNTTKHKVSSFTEHFENLITKSTFYA